MSVVDQTSGTSYSTLSEAIAGSSANDVIEISAGSYVENFPDITHNLTIEAVGGLAYLSNPQPDPPNGRAVINVPGNLNVSLTLNGLDISGAVDDASNPPSSGGANGAGILFESGNGALDVENCHIHNNEDGILTGSANTASLNGMTVTITNSEIDNNGVAPSNIRYGFDHNIYTGSLTQLTVTDSYIHDALGGHEIKSHADNTIIMDSRIQDGPTAGTSYSVDLEVGGVATIENNVIEKGPNAQNDAFIHYGGDVPTVAPNSSLTISDNTVIDDKASGQGPFVFDQAVFTDGGPIVVPTISGNTFYGPGPDNLLAGPNFGDGQSGAPYAPINTFLLITNAPPLDTSPPSAIPFLRWTTASNAAVAQAALAALQSSVTGGSETVVSYTGGSTLPALPTPTVTGIVVALGAGTAAHGPILLNAANMTSAYPTTPRPRRRRKAGRWGSAPPTTRSWWAAAVAVSSIPGPTHRSS